MSEEVDLETRQIYLIPTEGADGIQNTEVKENYLFFVSITKLSKLFFKHLTITLNIWYKYL